MIRLQTGIQIIILYANKRYNIGLNVTVVIILRITEEVNQPSRSDAKTCWTSTTTNEARGDKKLRCIRLCRNSPNTSKMRQKYFWPIFDLRVLQRKQGLSTKRYFHYNRLSQSQHVKMSVTIISNATKTIHLPYPSCNL